MDNSIRSKVNRVFSDGLMIALALAMAPIVLAPVLWPGLTPETRRFLDFCDIAILGVFILEYVLKLALAEDRRAHFLDPWHLLDLLIIALPFAELLPVAGTGLAGRSPLLRLLRTARILAVSGRSVKRRATDGGRDGGPRPDGGPAAILVAFGGEAFRPVDRGEMERLFRAEAPAWFDLVGAGEAEADLLAGLLGVSPYVLRSRLVDDSLPRADRIGQHTAVFLRDARTRIGLLAICAGPHVITLSKGGGATLPGALEAARPALQDLPLPVGALHALFRSAVSEHAAVLQDHERELLRLEETPRSEMPRDFLRTSFRLRKEMNRLLSGLRHLSRAVKAVRSGQLAPSGFGEDAAERFDVLLDEAAALVETTEQAQGDLGSLIELHINTTSHEMNRVMRLIAVFTCLAVIPTLVGGMLGMNLLGNPWDVRLWQVVVVTVAAMLGVGWVFLRLGWLED